MAKITYTDKETLNEIPSIPAKNKVQADDMNEIKNVVNQNELKILLIVDSSAPAECSTGDMYYNTTTKLIYTATGTNTWGSTGVNPTENTLYIDSTNKSTYFYNGSDLISVGGGAGGESLKIGTIVPFAGSTIPDGYLTCDGTAVSRTTYSDLFAIIGTTYGSGDGSTTFNLPNLKGRVPVGLDGTQTEFDTIGKTGGSKYLQEHKHSLYWGSTSGGTGDSIMMGANRSGTTSSQMLNEGTGDSGNLQPYLVVNYIIKVAETTPISSETVNTFSNSTKNAYSCAYVNSLITTQTETINAGTFTALGEKYNQTYTMTLPDGYNSFGILGYVLSGGGFSNLYLNELYVDGNTIHYSIKNGINAATSTITFTVYVGLIKGSNS